MVFFLPKQPVFFEHFKKLNASILEIIAVFAECVSQFKDFDIYLERAKKIEQAADIVTHEIVRKLHQTFITPFDREDLYKLVQEMDDIVDLVENAIRNIVVYQITEKKERVDEFAQVISEDCQVLDKLIRECFTKQKYTDDTFDLIIKIHELENRGDHYYNEALRSLFLHEKDPIRIIKWKDVFDNLEYIVDKFEQVCDTLEGIMVKAG